MIVREEYIEQILPYIDKPFVKVITGIRRSGKSELMKSLIERFQTNGITKDRIIYINFESFVWEHIKTATDLYNYITE
ncbi:MAG: ATP-binding protein, partial [Clostridia bacterium]|nr:ATP-binding protein [Clostridia bacterium]